MELTYEDVTTPIGVFKVAEADGAVVVAGFEEGWDRLIERLRQRHGITLRRGRTAGGAAVRAYFDGALDAFDAIEVRMDGSAFQSSVWQRLRSIPAGATLSYSQLAAAIGVPRASRAVGSANGANPISLIVPCHRVVRADGTTGGYGGGPDRKRWLLEHELALP